MKKTLLIIGLLISPLSIADTLQLPAGDSSQPAVDYSQLPQKGMLKTDVLSQFGDPMSMSAPIGDPPITRWAYSDFVVFFEYDHVINAVIPGKPRPIFNREELQAGSLR